MSVQSSPTIIREPMKRALERAMLSRKGRSVNFSNYGRSVFAKRTYNRRIRRMDPDMDVIRIDEGTEG